jgi:hypothetical protein
MDSKSSGHMGFVENEKLLVLSGESMVRNAGCLLQVCEDPEKMVHHAKRGHGESAERGCKRMGKKMIKSTGITLPPRLCQDARISCPDEDHLTMANCDGGGGCNLLFVPLSVVDAGRVSDVLAGSVGDHETELVAGLMCLGSGAW